MSFVTYLKTVDMFRSTCLMSLLLLLFIDNTSSSDQEEMGTNTNMGLRILKRGDTQFERIMKRKGEAGEWQNMKRNIDSPKENEDTDGMLPFLLIFKV